jgi:hypothetical protein
MDIRCPFSVAVVIQILPSLTTTSAALSSPSPPTTRK